MKKYDSLTDIQYGLLMKEGIIDLVGQIDEATSVYVREALIRAQAAEKIDGQLPPLKVLISSSGGLAVPGFEIVDAISNYPGQVTGVIQSYCRSMATIILQACDWRQATENSKILIHNPLATNVSWDILTNKKKLAASIARLRVTRKKAIDYLSRGTGRSFKEVAAQCAKNKDFTPKEAKAYGLIDEIIPAIYPR